MIRPLSKSKHLELLRWESPVVQQWDRALMFLIKTLPSINTISACPLSQLQMHYKCCTHYLIQWQPGCAREEPWPWDNSGAMVLSWRDRAEGVSLLLSR